MSDRPLRVLHVNTEDVGGGAAKVAWTLMQRQAVRGHDTMLAVGRKCSDDSHVFELPDLAWRGAWCGTLLRAAHRLNAVNDRVRGAWRAATALKWLA